MCLRPATLSAQLCYLQPSVVGEHGGSAWKRDCLSGRLSRVGLRSRDTHEQLISPTPRAKPDMTTHAQSGPQGAP